MIHLYRPRTSSFADEIEDRLKSLVLAHEVHLTDDQNGEKLPLVREGKTDYRGREEISAFLAEISNEVQTGRTMQSDSCVRNPDRPSSCL